MTLSEQDKISDLWTRLAAHLNEQLEKAHKSNEKSLSIEETAAIRGRIKLLRELLKLDSEPKPSATPRN